MVSTL